MLLLTRLKDTPLRDKAAEVIAAALLKNTSLKSIKLSREFVNGTVGIVIVIVRCDRL